MYILMYYGLGYALYHSVHSTPRAIPFSLLHSPEHQAKTPAGGRFREVG